MSAPVIPGTLFEDIKAYLDYTWNDETLDRKYQGFIRDGMAYVNGKYGEPADFETTGSPRTLLFEYVRYARDGALDVFENNYMSMILAMQNDKAVSRYAEKTVQTEQ